MKRFRTVHDARLSLWQSAAAEVAMQELRARNLGTDDVSLMQHVADHPMVRAATEHALRWEGRPEGPLTLPEANQVLSAAQLEAVASEIQFRLAEARLSGDAALVAELEAACRKYGTCDKAGWVSCATTYAKYRAWYGQPEYHHAYELPNDGVIQWKLPNDARVAILGDWGTGMADATAMLVAILKQHKPHAIIHLGDIYYSGTEAECQRTAEVIGQAFQEAGVEPVPFFTIPGNHEYYAMGKGFYQMLPLLNQSIPGASQEASFFCLRTEDGAWQFLGCDTGCDDSNPLHEAGDQSYPGPDLQGSEKDWAWEKLGGFAGSTIMLTHHPLFSQNWPIAGSRSSGRETPWLNQQLLQTFQPYFAKVAAWFWGHEHTFAMYQDSLFGLRKGRLVGCSAYQQHESDKPYTPRDERYAEAVPYHPAMKKLSLDQDGYYYHGYALLDFQRHSTTDPIHCAYYEFPSWNEEPPRDPAARKLCEERIESVMSKANHVTQANEAPVIRYGDRVILRHQSGRVITAAVQGKVSQQYYPRLENTGAVTLVIMGGRPGDPVGDYSTIQIMSTERAISPYNVLGAWTTDHYLYYYTPYDPAKQGWQVVKTDRSVRELRYGDPFTLVNMSFSGQRMCAEGEWLSTSLNARDIWVLQPEVRAKADEVPVMEIGTGELAKV